jgi:prepilin-type N-terminal cleavage/methylation domain-containing protein
MTVRRAGFTIMELLIVVVIIGITAAAAYPLAGAALARMDTRGARYHATTLITQARSAAQETGRTTTLSFAGNRALITASPRLVSVMGSTVDTIATPVDYIADYQVVVTGSNGTSIVFDSRGLASTGATTIRFTRGAMQDSVMVSDLGRVTR